MPTAPPPPLSPPSPFPHPNGTASPTLTRADWKSTYAILSSKVVSQQQGIDDVITNVNGHQTLDLVHVGTVPAENLRKPLTTDLSPAPMHGSTLWVAYQGVPEAAADKAYLDCDAIPCDQFEVSFQAVEIWIADRALLPVENYLGDSIHRNYAEELLAEAEEMAQTGILVSFDRELEEVVAISDPLKPNAAEAISLLKSMNIRSILVTGDNVGTAKSIAKEVGIETVIAEAKPDQKAEKVKDLQAEGYAVAMVGDGINDSPALVAADIGMAIGSGTDIAIEAADIVLMKSNLEDVISAIDLLRKTLFRILLNYFWALSYNMLDIPIAAGALFPSTGFRLPPWVAGTAMAASSVNVVFSSLPLKHYKRPKLPVC